MAKDLDSMAETAASLSFALKSAADTVKRQDTLPLMNWDKKPLPKTSPPYWIWNKSSTQNKYL